MKPAVITPYFDEPSHVLRACHQSVIAQTVECIHVFVSDGSINNFPLHNSKNLLHLRLPRNYADNGNTPRSVGATLAVAMGCDPILLLDADNWYSSDHVENAIRLKVFDPELDVVFSSRNIVLDDGTCYANAPEDASRTFADTSTMCFFGSSFRVLPLFSFIPRELSPICDRIIFSTIRSLGLKAAWSEVPSLFFRSHYCAHYILAGKVPSMPLHDPDWGSIRAMLDKLLPIYCSRAGVDIRSIA